MTGVQTCALPISFMKKADRDHVRLRTDIVEYMKVHKEVFKDFVTITWSDYLAYMATPGKYGDNLTLVALATMLQIKIEVLTAGDVDQCIVPHDHIGPNDVTKLPTVYIIYYPESLHYNLAEHSSTESQCPSPDGANLVPPDNPLRNAKRERNGSHRLSTSSSPMVVIDLTSGDDECV